jgi:hypothetical protein
MIFRSDLTQEEDAMTARQIIEARLGRSLGPLATMPRDLRRAIYLLALHLQRQSSNVKGGDA